jgi:hypothetical protein
MTGVSSTTKGKRWLGHPWRMMAGGMGGWDHDRGMCAGMASAFLSRNDYVPVGLVNALGAEGVLK